MIYWIVLDWLIVIYDSNLVFGGELGTQVKIDEKKNHYVINGKHDADQLQSLLDVFIDKCGLCQSCKNPETEFVRLLSIDD